MHREIQALLIGNQHLARIHVALKQDLIATQDELRCLSAIAAEVKAKRDVEVLGIVTMSKIFKGLMLVSPFVPFFNLPVFLRMICVSCL